MYKILQIILGSNCQVLKMTILMRVADVLCLSKRFQISCLFIFNGCISHSRALAGVDIVQRER